MAAERERAAVAPRRSAWRKMGLPPIAAISGVIRSATIAVTTAVKAVPMTTATARLDDIAAGDEVPETLHVADPLGGWATQAATLARLSETFGWHLLCLLALIKIPMTKPSITRLVMRHRKTTVIVMLSHNSFMPGIAVPPASRVIVAVSAATASARRCAAISREVRDPVRLRRGSGAPARPRQTRRRARRTAPRSRRPRP